jgi:hypothetical protein
MKMPDPGEPFRFAIAKLERALREKQLPASYRAGILRNRRQVMAAAGLAPQKFKTKESS